MPIAFNEHVSQLVPDLPQESLSPLDFVLVLDALRRESVHHAQDATALIHLSKHHFGRIGRRKKCGTPPGPFLMRSGRLMGKNRRPGRR